MTAAATTLPPIFGLPEALPRGPHNLTRDHVALAQRQRLLDAVVRVVAEHGYARATIAEIARRARVSPNAFYEHFADKEACYLAAYDVFARTLLERIAGEIAPQTGWQDFLAAALDAYLGTVAAEPIAARAFILEMDAAGPTARARRYEAYAAFASVIRQRHEELRRLHPELEPLPDLASMAIVHGVRELVCDALEGRIAGSVTDMSADIRRWLTATFQGAGAERVSPSRPDEGRA